MKRTDNESKNEEYYKKKDKRKKNEFIENGQFMANIWDS